MTLEDQMLLEEYQRDRKRFREDANKANHESKHSIHELRLLTKGQADESRA